MCNSCLGRLVAGQLLSGFNNEERGRILRQYCAFLVDSGEKLDIDSSNFYGIKFSNVKPEIKKPGKCRVCKNFFQEELDELSRSVIKKLKDIEFSTFLVGSVPSNEMLNQEENLQEIVGIEFSEPIKSETNRN